MIPSECLDRIEAEHKSKMEAARVSTVRLMDRIAELEALLKEAHYILANNAAEGDETAKILCGRIADAVYR
jgi:hypothetical protein